MNYRYQRNQIFGKRLKVPKGVLRAIYNNALSFQDYLKYDLIDKIPISCLRETDRKIVEIFGVDRCKTLDWELIDKYIYDLDVPSIVTSISPQVEDINKTLYELVKDKIRPSDYSSKMKEVYKDKLFTDNDNVEDFVKSEFNEGRTSLKDIITNWDLYKGKDLSFCLANNLEDTSLINDTNLKSLMTKYDKIIQVILNNIYMYNVNEFINNIISLNTEEEQKEFLKKYIEEILNKNISLDNASYKEIFKYYSMQDYLAKISNSSTAYNVMNEINNLEEDYIFNMPFSFSEICNRDVLRVIEIYGLKNIVDFDNENGQFFSKNNCENLKLILELYLHYPRSNERMNVQFKKEGNYSLNDFYEVVRRMLLYGPSDETIAKGINNRDMTGKFREINKDLFISEEVPEDLQKMFYERNITPEVLYENPNYLEYLKEKNLEKCFRPTNVSCSFDSFNSLISLYGFLNKFDYNSVMDFIISYRDILVNYNYTKYVVLAPDDNLGDIKKKFNESFRRAIIELKMSYLKNIPYNIIESFPNIFLPKDAPEELQTTFYNRKVTIDFILSHPEYMDYLRNVDLETIYNYMPVKTSDGVKNLISIVKEKFGKEESFDTLLLYGKYIETCFDENLFNNFVYNENASKGDLLNEIDKVLLDGIIKGKMKYSSNMPSHFKNVNPTLFLSENVSKEISDKFYNREFSIEDFNDNKELLEIIGNTNVACGFPLDVAWIIPLFSETSSMLEANTKRLKIISEYVKINDFSLSQKFKEYILKNIDNLDMSKVKFVSKILSRISMSNSSEIYTFREELADQIINSDNPIETFDKIENIFIKNNIPTVGKIYSCFEALHPNFKGFNFYTSKISPTLINSSTERRKMIVFSDLIKAHFGSNNRSVNDYLNNIEIGYSLYKQIKSGQISYDMLSETDKNELITFVNHLKTLYENTLNGREETNIFSLSGDVISDIDALSKKLSPNPQNENFEYNLADRVVKMFCGFAGFGSLEQAKNYIEQKIKNADARNRKTASDGVTLEAGDFIKGIGGIKYLGSILQNGSVSKEYLGESATSDSTPLDTDITVIANKEGTLSYKIDNTISHDYGPIWFVLKNDDRFIVTRSDVELLYEKKDYSKLEVFYTGVLGKYHYGIRTGFASSEIDYIITQDNAPKIGLEVALNGFYIPVVNRNGKIIFSPKDYDILREKMSGLSYYNENNYNFAPNLVTPDTEQISGLIEQNEYEVKVKRDKINEIIRTSVQEIGLTLKTVVDGDLTDGSVELIDTGSTGRGTNNLGDGDFDFIMRVDKALMLQDDKLRELKSVIARNLGIDDVKYTTSDGDFRLKGVQIDNETIVDIDISFIQKTNKVVYSTEMSVQDRLETIRKNDPEKYKYVIANIILAKKVLKEARVYKPKEGGLGGIGIENWILQNGGSFIDAASNFVNAANGKSFEEFKESYQIWDFGQNHFAERKGFYPHDEFVSQNMSEYGYQLMTKTLSEYLQFNLNQNNEVTISR